MSKKRVVILLLFLVFIFTSSVNFFLISQFVRSPQITGRGLIGTISLFVEGGVGSITIYVPENTTYDFSSGDIYLIELNVSDNFNADDYKYTLYDERHDVVESEDISFSPNTTFTAVRWENNLSVYARLTGGPWFVNSTSFYIDVPISAPILGAIDDEIYVCEGARMGYNFNATDIDEEDLEFSISPPYPTGPFSVPLNPIGTVGRTIKLSWISSSIFGLTKAQAGGIDGGSKSALYTISVIDTASTSDSKVVNITVIEINNNPTLSIGVQTVYLTGDDSTFLLQPPVTDTEDGTNSDGNLSFNLSYSNGTAFTLFEINITNGTMVHTPNEDGDDNGVYNLKVCVNDTGIANPHEGIVGNCSQTGGVSVVCDTFSLTITNTNRAPTITAYSPEDLTPTVLGTNTLTFSVTTYDADGTIPDVNWYLDGVFKEIDEGSSTATYSYTPSCDTTGVHNIVVNVTDGVDNATLQWNVSVTQVACPEGVAAVGGGGGGGGVLGKKFFCREEWGCNNWRVCQNTKRSFDLRAISPEDYFYIKEICAQINQDERFCGFQTTTCFDLNACNNTRYRVAKPNELRVCYFTEDPNCEDGITNCHDGLCELLVDCGGPCDPCPTCSDDIQNQGEDNVDCGGPCPFLCEAETPKVASRILMISLIIVSSAAVLFIIYKAISILLFAIRGKKKRR